MDEIDQGGTAAQHHIITTAQKEVGSGSMCEYLVDSSFTVVRLNKGEEDQVLSIPAGVIAETSSPKNSASFPF